MTVETATTMNLPRELRTMPILPLRGMVLFPGVTVPVFVGRERSKRAIEVAAASDMLLSAHQRRRGLVAGVRYIAKPTISEALFSYRRAA